jgi:hypothetical protein
VYGAYRFRNPNGVQKSSQIVRESLPGIIHDPRRFVRLAVSQHIRRDYTITRLNPWANLVPPPIPIRSLVDILPVSAYVFIPKIGKSVNQKQGKVPTGGVVLGQLVDVVVFSTSAERNMVVVEGFWAGWIHVGGDHQLRRQTQTGGITPTMMYDPANPRLHPRPPLSSWIAG